MGGRREGGRNRRPQGTLEKGQHELCVLSIMKYFSLIHIWCVFPLTKIPFYRVWIETKTIICNRKQKVYYVGLRSSPGDEKFALRTKFIWELAAALHAWRKGEDFEIGSFLRPLRMTERKPGTNGKWKSLLGCFPPSSASLPPRSPCINIMLNKEVLLHVIKIITWVSMQAR